MSSNKAKFFAELIGTFVVVTLATGSVVIDAKSGGTIGLWFVAFAPFVGVSAMVKVFGKVSMAHFNPAVTLAFLITKHMSRSLLPLYLCAQIVGAFLASLFVKYIIGEDANLGANAPDYSYPIPLIVGVEIFATALLVLMILFVVYKKGVKGFGPILIGGIIGLDIFFLSFISGASMNPVRSLAPAVLSGFVNDLWLYLSATFVGSLVIAFICKRFFK